MAEITSDMVVIEPRAQHPNDNLPWQSKILEGVDDFRKFAGQTFSQLVPQAGKTDKDASSEDTEETAEHETEEEQKKMRHAQLIVKKTLGLDPGPQITLKCIDVGGGKKGVKDVIVEWKHSWEDVLRQLKRDFKRDVIFEYEVAGRVCRVHDDATFDRAMALAERSGNKLFVVIQDAVWKTAPEEVVEQEEPEPEEQVSSMEKCAIHSFPSSHCIPAQILMVTCHNRMEYHPAEYKSLLFFATAGAAVSLGVALAAISSLGNNWTYLFAHSITIAFPSFLIGPPLCCHDHAQARSDRAPCAALFIRKTQADTVTVVQAAVAAASVGFGLASAVLYALIPGGYAMDAVIAAILIILGGAFNLWAGFNNSVAYVRKVRLAHAGGGRPRSRRDPAPSCTCPRACPDPAHRFLSAACGRGRA